MPLRRMVLVSSSESDAETSEKVRFWSKAVKRSERQRRTEGVWAAEACACLAGVSGTLGREAAGDANAADSDSDSS